MGILKYHPTSHKLWKRLAPGIACLEDLIKSNQASHQGARWISSVYAKSTCLGSNYRNISSLTQSDQNICRGLWIIIAELISHDLSHGVPLMYVTSIPVCFRPTLVSLASGAEVRFVPPPPVKYSSLDAGSFCRYEWAYPVQYSLYFNANVSVVLWRGRFVDFRRRFWVHSGSGLAVQLGRAWCTLPVSGEFGIDPRLQVL
jgi:hypothetical protein